jgi:Zn-dependent M16 (insulinase) family peptidase
LQEKVHQYFKSETQNLEEKVKNLKEADKQRIFENGKALALVQKAQEDINCLPCLKLQEEAQKFRFNLAQRTPTAWFTSEDFWMRQT